VVNRDAILSKSAVAQSEGAAGAVAGATEGAGSAKSASGKSAKRVKGAASANGWPRKCEHCEDMIGSPNAKGAHMKKHHPELCIRKAIPVEAMK
jgi:hypothetical protein